MKSSNRFTPMLVGVLAVAIVAGVGGYLFVPHDIADKIAGGSSTSANVSQVTTSPATTSTTTSTAQSYKDGTYNATASYRVPGGGTNSVQVTLTVKSDTITAVSVSNNISESQPQYYTDSFAANIESAVVSTPLKSAYASRVGGASLTSGAFDDALQAITNDAKA